MNWNKENSTENSLYRNENNIYIHIYNEDYIVADYY